MSRLPSDQAEASTIREPGLLDSARVWSRIGWLGFGEKMTAGKAVSVAMIAGGVALTRI